MMEVEQCANKTEWDNFILANSDIFLQSSAWGDLQKKNNKKVFRFQCKENLQIIAQAQIVKERVSFKNYFYIPFGPIFQKNISEHQREGALVCLLDKIKNLSSNENAIFLRIEPTDELPIFNDKSGVIPSLKRLQPQKTLLIDLSKNNEDILKSFKAKTRQNINFAKKHGIMLRKGFSYFPEFYRLLKMTKERKAFGTHSENYYKNILQAGDSNLKTELFVAEYQHSIVGSAIAVFFGDKVSLLHGGLDYNINRRFKSSTFLYWEIMQLAKKQGYLRCDLWGVDEEKWPGITMYKKSFGGEEKTYPPGVDIILDKFWYRIYKMFKSFK